MGSSRYGTLEFVVQRISALVIGFYGLCLTGFFLWNIEVSFSEWVTFFLSLPMQVFSTCAVIAIVIHAWIGTWIVITDYIRKPVFGRSTVFVRGIAAVFTVGVLLVILLYAFRVVWL